MMGDCWKVNDWGDAPKPIKIIKETEKSYTVESHFPWDDKIRTYRIMKSSHNIFQSWEDAKNYMIESASRKLEFSKQEVDRRRSELERVKALKK